jgi:hypothetical protein
MEGFEYTAAIVLDSGYEGVAVGAVTLGTSDAG